MKATTLTKDEFLLSEEILILEGTDVTITGIHPCFDCASGIKVVCSIMVHGCPVPAHIDLGLVLEKRPVGVLEFSPATQQFLQKLRETMSRNIQEAEDMLLLKLTSSRFGLG